MGLASVRLSTIGRFLPSFRCVLDDDVFCAAFDVLAGSFALGQSIDLLASDLLAHLWVSDFAVVFLFWIVARQENGRTSVTLNGSCSSVLFLLVPLQH